MSSPALPSRQRSSQEREQLDLFRALPGYQLGIQRMPGSGAELLTFRPLCPVPPTARG